MMLCFSLIISNVLQIFRVGMSAVLRNRRECDVASERDSQSVHPNFCRSMVTVSLPYGSACCAHTAERTLLTEITTSSLSWERLLFQVGRRILHSILSYIHDQRTQAMAEIDQTNLTKAAFVLRAPVVLYFDGRTRRSHNPRLSRRRIMVQSHLPAPSKQGVVPI